MRSFSSPSEEAKSPSLRRRGQGQEADGLHLEELPQEPPPGPALLEDPVHPAHGQDHEPGGDHEDHEAQVALEGRRILERRDPGLEGAVEEPGQEHGRHQRGRVEGEDHLA